MNPYPSELLVQLAPVMFVAGLGVHAPAETSVTTSPGAPRPSPQDLFEVLCLRLRDAFLLQRKPAVWQSEKVKTFQVILVDKDVRFPPRKISPPGDAQQSAVLHSPLSPLTPTSPLYPDGIIAPIWIRKHTQLLPSVFVLFTRLYESPAAHLPRSPLDPPHPDKEVEEKRKDTDLSAEIAARKKSTGERGIKLTVVLLASRKMLDDPTLDARLSFIRRQSGLDSRAALFVLSPVSPAELSEFIKSLQQALYDPAVEYYTSHSKRVRRKRNRHAQSAGASLYMGPLPPIASADIRRPLRPEGWTVRYEYKMACFAEFRGEDEIALKHYQDAYAALIIMFGSIVMLPPRTKRWAEAKVLADCISIKICKLYLYNNEHSLALLQHNAHVRKFGDFSRGWGIGEETFEFWSWIARQHRVFAELIEQGLRSTLVLPTYLHATPAPQSQSQSTILDESARILGLNPANALQHPGFFFYMAARASEKRRSRFLAVNASSPQLQANAPGFANEKKVDHLAITLDLYAKAYDHFKKYNATNTQDDGRLILRIAYCIGQTSFEAGKFDLAVKVFEGIAKMYRREKWGLMLKPLLSTWYACAQQMGDVELSVQLLVEMLAHGRDECDEEDSVEEDLLAVLRNTMPSRTDEPLHVDLSEAFPIFHTSVVFWKPSVAVNERTAFQLSFSLPEAVSLSSLYFSQMAIYFSHRSEPIIVRHTPSDAAVDAPLKYIDLGDVLPGSEHKHIESGLKWRAGETMLITGTVASEEPLTLKIDRAVLTLREGKWTIELPIGLHCSREDAAVSAALWYTSLNPPISRPMTRTDVSEVSVDFPPHQLHIEFSHHHPACLDEEYPITVEISNLDERPFEVTLDVLLQPTEIDDAVNSIRIDEERSSGLIKGILLGLIPSGVTISKTIYLTSTGAAGDRILDVSVQTFVTEQGDATETLETLSIPTVAPITVQHDIQYMRSRKPMPALTDLASYESDFWDESIGGQALINTHIVCAGPHCISVERAQLVRKDGTHAQVVECSLDLDGDSMTSDWLPDDEFAAAARVSMMVDEDAEEGDSVPGPGYYELTWRRIHSDGEDGPLCTSTFALPSLTPPRDGVIALLSLPSSARLHVPTHAHLTIRNHHPARSADVHVNLEPDASDAFLVAGTRICHVPALLPGTEVCLTWTMVPLECGYVRVPRIRVIDRRSNKPVGVTPAPEEEGVLVRIVDLRRDGRGLHGGEEKDVTRIEDEVAQATSAGTGTYSDAIGPVLVMP